MANEFKVKNGLKFPDNTTQTTAAQAVLVSGTNIKTINNTTLLGSGDISLSTVSTLDDLTDVVITTPTNNQVLKYNGTNWINSAGGISLTDLSVTDVSGDGSLAYNSTTGVFTYTGPSASDVRAHFTSGTGITITSGQIATTITQYTDTLARASISVTQNLSYDNQTGIITGPSLTAYEQTANKNQANGYAGLDGSGKVASAQLPSYVDDVLEYQDLASLPATGDTGKIYVTLGTNKTYRWTGSVYVEISASPGSTDSVTEGTTNLYFTNTRSRESISVTDVSGDGSLAYNSTTGVFTYTGPSASDVRAHFTAGTGIQISSGEISTTITQYTDTLARSALSFTAGTGAYNSTTGVITIPTNTTHLTNGSGYITLSSLSAGTGITYNNTTGQISTTITQYTNTDADARISAASINALSDVVITTPSSGQVLKYNGTNWINDTDASGAGNLDALSDVVITTPSSGQVLKYNGTNWINDTDATGAGGGGASLDDVIALSLALG